MEKKLKTEKLTVNVGTMDLSKIDMLVDNLIYTNRSDFCRLAIRELLEKHNDDFEKLYSQYKQVHFESSTVKIGGIGIIKLSESDLYSARSKKKEINILVTGLLIVDKNITIDLFKSTVSKVKVYGKIQASNSILEYIKKEEKKNE